MSWQGLDFDLTGVAFDGGDFGGARFSGGTVHFGGARFSGSTVHFTGARFSSGTVDLSRVADWSHPPEFGWGGSPPSGVKLPAHDGGQP